MNKETVPTKIGETAEDSKPVAAPVRVKAYDLPNGFSEQAEHMYRWLTHEGFTPQWCDSFEPGGMAITIPENEVGQLRLFQKTNPARWGNPPTEIVANTSNNNESKTIEQGQALVDEALDELGLTRSKWEPPHSGWQFTNAISGDQKIRIGVSSGGVVQVNRNPYTPAINLDEFYRRYPEIHLDETNNGRWNYSHDYNYDDNDSQLDRDCWIEGVYGTEAAAMAGALDQYAPGAIPNLELNVTKEAVLFSIEVALHGNASSEADDLVSIPALKNMRDDIKGRLVALNATSLEDGELERVFGTVVAPEFCIHQAQLARKAGVTMVDIKKESDQENLRLVAKRAEHERSGQTRDM